MSGDFLSRYARLPGALEACRHSACVVASDQGADANARNKSHNIALHYHKGRADVIEALLPSTKAIDSKVRACAWRSVSSKVVDGLLQCNVATGDRH